MLSEELLGEVKTAGLAILAALLLVSGIANWVQHKSNETTEQNLATARASVTDLTAKNSSLAQTIKDQNGSIEGYEQRAKANQEALLAAQQAAANVHSLTATDVAKIVAANVPKDCKGAMGWGREQAQELSKW